MTAGATVWYAWGSRFENTQDYSIRKNNNYTFDPTFLYGPVLSVKFSDDFNLTFVYLYSKFGYNEDVYKDLGGNFFVKSNIKRADSDIALNYKLNDYFKVFAGAKYLSYKISLSFDDPNPEIGHCNSHSEHKSIGPGLGLSTTYPITNNIFLLGTVSGFYLFSKGEKFYDHKIYDKYPKPVNITIGYNEYGINSSLSVAYYIAKLSTVISLGGRFQYFVTDYYDYKFFYINYIRNMIYGVTLSATYTFSI
jgi:long-subunit fatty acid transport protein